MPAEYSREEQLVRLYQLRDQLDVDDMIALAQCEPAEDGACADCKREAKRVVYGRVAVCEGCALQRIRVYRRNRDR
jgi:hypothetical protein